MHKLLARQLKKAARARPDGSVDYGQLLELVGAAYEEADKERQLSRRAFGLMSDELLELNRSLKAEAEARSKAQMQLVDAIESLTEGFVLYDADDRLVLCNSKYREIYGAVAELLVPGTRFADALRAAIERGQIPEAAGQEEEWIARRLHAHRDPPEAPIEHQTSEGRWIRVSERKTREGGIVGARTDITERKRAELLQEGRNKVLERVAAGAPIEEVLSILVASTEEVRPGMICSVLLLDRETNQLRHGAAPSLPDFYNDAIDGLEIGSGVGSCGTAAHSGKRVIVENVMVHPHWVEFRELAQRAGVRACWSQPIISSASEILGTFAVYYREPRAPDAADLELITTAAHLASIAIERKRAEEELHQARSRIELVLNSAGEGIYGLDLEGRTTFANPAAAKMVGWEVQELIGKPQHAVLHHTKPDGRPYPREECPIYAALKDGSVHHVDTELFWRKDGSSFPVEYVSSPIRDERGELTGAVVIFSDITERKRTQERWRRAEERLRDAIESVADGFVLFDSDDRVVMWNQRFADLYPELAHMLPTKPTAEEMFRERYRVGAVGEFDIPVDEYVGWRMEMRQKRGGTPAIHRNKDGRWFRTTERKTREGGIVAISTDVTELKNSEAESRAAKEQAEFANRSKSEFLANMSHELRTPLNAINGFSEMMVQELFGPVGQPQYQGYVKDIFDSGSLLLDLIDDILDLAKVEAGKQDLDEDVVDVAQSVRACFRVVAERAKGGGLSLTTRLAKDLPGLFADERAIKQIILNLLSNAIKFTPEGGKIAVRARVDRNGGMVLDVADSGIGIAADDMTKVLSPFGQVDSSLTRQHQGTGLGLPLVKSLVELHGGTLELKSKVGAGTTVTVRFPAERVLRHPSGYAAGPQSRAAS